MHVLFKSLNTGSSQLSSGCQGVEGDEARTQSLLLGREILQCLCRLEPQYCFTTQALQTAIAPIPAVDQTEDLGKKPVRLPISNNWAEQLAKRRSRELRFDSKGLFSEIIVLVRTTL